METKSITKDDAIIEAMFLYEQIFCRFGTPLKLVSDRGKHFLNQTVEEMTTLYRVEHCKTTLYHPKANKLTESTNDIIDKILNKTVALHKTDWDVKVLLLCMPTIWLTKSPQFTPLTT